LSSGPARRGETIGWSGYLSMNAAAWQPSRTGREKEIGLNPPDKSQDKTAGP
jgi:hypothetical protein